MRKKIVNVPYALKFDGEGYANCGQLGDFGSNMANEFSFDFTFQTLYKSTTQNYFIGAVGGSTYLLIGVSPTGVGGGAGKIFISLRDSNAKRLSVYSIDRFDDNKIHRFTGTKDNTNTRAGLKMYIDGVEIDKYLKNEEGFSAPTDFTSKLAIGAVQGNSPSVIVDRTLIGPVTFWKRELSSTEVQEMHNTGELSSGYYERFPLLEGGGKWTKSEDGETTATLSKSKMWSTETIGCKRNSNIMARYPSKTDSDSSKIATHCNYGITATGDAANEGNTDTNEWDWLMGGWSNREMQNGGQVTHIKANLPDVTKIVSLKFTQWRKNSSGTYDLITKSENVIGSMESGVKSTHEFATPFDIQLGDFFGFRLQQTEAGDTFRKTTGLGYNYALRYNTTLLDGSNDFWESKTTLSQVSAEFELYGDAPQALVIGDSVMAGHAKHYTFAESSSDAYFYPETTIAHYLLKHLSSGSSMPTYQNVSIGGQTVEQIKNRFQTDAIDKYPAMIIMDGLVNDAGAGRTEEQVLADYTTIIGLCQTAGVPLFIMLGVPLSNGDATEAALIDTLNSSVKTLVDSYDDVYYFDPTPFLGKERTDGTSGNAWDIPLALTLQPTVEKERDTAEAGTTTTTINATAHGLEAGQYIWCESRGGVYRKVLTVPTSDSFTVNAVGSQAEGDTFIKLFTTDIVHPNEKAAKLTAYGWNHKIKSVL